MFVPAFGREIDDFCEERDVSNITYSIKEGIPDRTELNSRVYTERYEGGIDQEVLTDTCVLDNVFQESKMYLKAYDASAGTNGTCCIFSESDSPNDSVKYYIVPKNKGVVVDMNYMTVKTEDGSRTFAHGYYNEKSKNDKKGSTATVEIKGGKFIFSVTQDNGAKVTKTANNEAELYNEGVSLTHKYILGTSYKTNLVNIAGVLSVSPRLKIVTNNNSGVSDTGLTSAFTGNDYEAVIGVYENENANTENKMIVYRIYPIGSFDVMYPASNGGVAPYMNAPADVTYNKEEQTVSIAISTNVKFEISSSVDWITPITPLSGYNSTSDSIQITLGLNGSGTNRTGVVTLHCVEPGVTLADVRINVHQSKDEIAEIQSEIDTVEGQIRELSGNTSS